MGAAYTIFGRQVQPYVLSLLTLGSVAGVIAWPRSSSPAEKPAVVAPAASSTDDFDLEKIINDFTKDDSK